MKKREATGLPFLILQYSKGRFCFDYAPGAIYITEFVPAIVGLLVYSAPFSYSTEH